MTPRWRNNVLSLWAVALILVQLWLASGVGAQVAPPSNPSQFDVTGFIQAATLDPTCATNVLCGGTITVNNQLITVPANTILQMPALALTWQQVFAQAPAAYLALGQSGLAMKDGNLATGGTVPPPLRTYEVHVQGNRVGNTYIAGLMFLAQSSLMSGQGFINAIDLTTGMFEVGGTVGVAGTGQRVMINDPAGKFGRASDPTVIDARFTIDENNPTVRSETGYPMCIPRSAADALCPQANRPLDPTTPSGFAMVFTYPAVANVVAGSTDPRLMAPFEVGDYVSYSGILVNDPAPATTTYVAAYQVIANVGLFTAPGDVLAYVATDVMLLGTGGQTVAGLTEATARTRFEGFTTDPSRHILLWGIDVDPCTGAQSPRNWGSIDVDPGPPLGVVLGRWRFRPPTTVLTMPSAGAFLPPTREMRATIETALGSGIPAAPFLVNGVALPGSSQYQAPIFEFLFPENAAVGSPIVPNNFETFPFLANGSGPLDPTQLVGATNPLVGQLNPWPGLPAPTAVVCGAPAALPAPPAASIAVSPSSTVLQKTTVTLDGSGSIGTGLTFNWAAPAGIVLSSATASKVTFVAPSFNVDTTLSFTLTVKDTAGQTSTATAKVLVKASSFSPLAPVAKVVISPSATVFSGTLVTLDASGSTDPQGLALTFAWSGPNPPTLNPSRTAPKVTFIAPTVTQQTTYNFSLNVSNGPKTTSVSNIIVTVKPAPDTITFTGVLYRISQLRLTVDATDSNPTATLTMQAWADAAETTPIGPALPMIFNGAAVPPALEAILVGFQQPDHVTVTSSTGTVARSPILTVRQ
ncbi:MAG TPA: hypothetical protein VLM91_10740 [Candidatus Methylomirabilis sp.]|nr:hypothetical protein [Candidatus Methylomirabilis sp.]